MIKQNNNIDTISIVGRTELEDVRVYSNDRSDIDKSIVNVGMTGQLTSSGNISSIEEIIMSADNIKVCRTDLSEEIISNNRQSFNCREKQSKNVS